MCGIGKSLNCVVQVLIIVIIEPQYVENNNLLSGVAFQDQYLIVTKHLIIYNYNLQFPSYVYFK